MRADKSSSTSKKYWVSAYYAIPRIISLCAFCLFFADMTISYIRRTSIIDASFYCIWGAFAVLLNVYLLLCDVKSFRVSFSEEGITLHTPVRKLFTSWNEIHHVRTFETQVHSGTNFTSCPLHWVIFSKRQVMTILQKNPEMREREAPQQCCFPYQSQTLRRDKNVFSREISRCT